MGFAETMLIYYLVASSIYSIATVILGYYTYKDKFSPRKIIKGEWSAVKTYGNMFMFIMFAPSFFILTPMFSEVARVFLYIKKLIDSELPGKER